MPPLTSLKNVVRGTALEPAAKKARNAVRPAKVRRNTREDELLRSLLRLTLPRDAFCIDVGANIGAILEAIVQVAPDGRHMAFEPVPDLHRQLTEQFPTVEVRNEALSDREGSATFTVVPSRASRSGLATTLDLEIQDPTQEIEVRTAKLDDLVDRQPTFVKIDVEGGELEVLRGARSTLSALPLLAFEHQYAHRFDRERTHGVWQELAGLGYRVYDMDGNEFGEATFVGAVEHHHRWNFIAHR